MNRDEPKCEYPGGYTLQVLIYHMPCRMPYDGDEWACSSSGGLLDEQQARFACMEHTVSITRRLKLCLCLAVGRLPWYAGIDGPQAAQLRTCPLH